MAAIADLGAEDGTAELSFAMGDSPRRLDGREAVRGCRSGYPERMDLRPMPTVTVHRTERGGTLVVEFTAHGRTGTRCAPARPTGSATARWSPSARS
ncbi:hypothetical protein [Streptomyces axinellae]|uniref:hypothetical protein n=1 Tax=Streptomyces axinellae TaxID=552788 RepID=UPI0031D3872B